MYAFRSAEGIFHLLLPPSAKGVKSVGINFKEGQALGSYLDCITVVYFANASDAVNIQTKGLERV